jgi:DNA-binding LacI/PurR family transcriptional regulator
VVRRTDELSAATSETSSDSVSNIASGTASGTASREVAPRPPTPRDVGRLAGVSAQTVSRVVNNQQPVASGTRAAVLHAVAELHYRPNRAAQTLVTHHSRLIGLVIAQINDRGDAAAAIRAIDLAAQRQGYAIIIRHVSIDAPALTTGQIGVLLDQGVEGIIALFASTRLIQALTMSSPQVPVAYLEAADNQSEFPSRSEHQQETPYDARARAAVEQVLSPPDVS